MEVGGEGLTGASHAALHLIEYEERAHFIATPAERREEVGTEVHCAGESLYGLDDHCSGPARHLGANGAGIDPRQEAHVERRAREAVPLRLRTPGHGARRGGAAVEAALDGGHVPARGGAQRDLERVLIRLGATVDEEHPRIRQPRETYEALGRTRPYRHGDGVRLELAE